MASQNPDNADYLNFIVTLNDLLTSVEIRKLNYS